jgi:hypothetical protein
MANWFADEATSEMSKLFQSAEIITVEFDNEVKLDVLSKIKKIEYVRLVRSKVYEITGIEGADIRKIIFEWAVKNEVQILEMNTKEISLEHVFRKLTQ